MHSGFPFVVFENIALPRNKLKGPNPLFNSSFYLSYDIGLKTSKDVAEKVCNLSIDTCITSVRIRDRDVLT